MLTQANDDKMSRGQKTMLAILIVVVPLFGALVVCRSCFMERRHTDFGVYARAGWAVRAGHDIYDITDDGGLHYCYPPPFAVAMTPFAEPPTANVSGRYLPFAVSVCIWFALSFAFAIAATHFLASALESTGELVGSRRHWWALRLWPVLLTLPALGNNLSHGQVNSLLLLLVAGMFASLIRGQSRLAGAWLAGAIALKVIPAFLALIPLVRRDRRCFAGLTLGLLVLLIGIPAMTWGPAKMWRYNRKFVDVMLHPAMTDATQADRAKEMFHVLRTDNQSMQATFHAWQHWGDADAPAEPSPRTRALHWLIGIALTVTTLAAASRRLAGNELMLFGGALTVVMLLVSPMCHLHYYVLTMPLVTALLFAALKCDDHQHVRRTQIAFTLHVVGGAIPLLFEAYRNLGFAPVTTLPLWALAVNELRNPRVAAVMPQVVLRKAA